MEELTLSELERAEIRDPQRELARIRDEGATAARVEALISQLRDALSSAHSEVEKRAVNGSAAAALETAIGDVLWTLEAIKILEEKAAEEVADAELDEDAALDAAIAGFCAPTLQ